MITEIKDESRLPGPPEYRQRASGTEILNVGAREYYIRSICDPSVYIHGESGAVFRRGDGQLWKHPAISVERVAHGDKSRVTRRIASAWGDPHIYDYAGKE